MTENEISRIVIESALKVHRALGPGLLESAYLECLTYELGKTQLHIENQKSLPLIYLDVKLNAGFRVDIMIENKFIVEVKAVESISDLHLAQIITYLKLADCKLGLLINFNVPLLKQGLRRIANNFIEY